MKIPISYRLYQVASPHLHCILDGARGQVDKLHRRFFNQNKFVKPALASYGIHLFLHPAMRWQILIEEYMAPWLSCCNIDPVTAVFFSDACQCTC